MLIDLPPLELYDAYIKSMGMKFTVEKSDIYFSLGAVLKGSRIVSIRIVLKAKEN